MDDYFTRLSRDIILTYILPRLDGKTLIILSSVSSEFFNLINDDLWRNICISTWPSLLSYGQIMLSEIISTTFPGGYRSLFSEAFPSIHHRNPRPPPPPPPSAHFTYAIDLFLHGEREPLYTDIQYQQINIYPIHAPWWISTVGSNSYFQLLASNVHLNFIPVNKDKCEKYLKEKLRLSCVLISSSRYHDQIPRKHAWGLFNSSCKPVVYVTRDKRCVEAMYTRVMPGLYKEMVKFQVKVNCGWKDGEEDRFFVRSIGFRMKYMNGEHLKVEYAAKVLLNAIENGERKKK